MGRPNGLLAASARCATTLSTSRRIAALLARIMSQYAAKARRVARSVEEIRVSQLMRVPFVAGSIRNSIPTLIQPGSDQA